MNDHVGFYRFRMTTYLGDENGEGHIVNLEVRPRNVVYESLTTDP